MTEEELLRVIEQAASQGWTELDLSGNQLSVLPPEIVQLTNLQTLDLSGNQLSVLPPEIVQLTNLQTLDLGGNQLSVLPPEIVQLTNLQTLDLSGNQLSALPPEIGQLTNLQTLDLHGNQLKGLLPEIGQLTNLQSLDLSRNQLSALPPEIGQLTNLQSLDLSFIPLVSLPKCISQLFNLKSLQLMHTQLQALPDWLCQLANLQMLDIFNNEVTFLPDSIGQLANLKILILSGNFLNSLPDSMIHLIKLEELYFGSHRIRPLRTFGRTKFSSLPRWLTELTQLRILDLGYCKLRQLPELSNQFSNLQKLYLNNNYLDKLPPDIGKLTNLQSLDLSHNQLSQLPAEIVQLTNLQTLNLNSNQLSQLPTEIVQLTNLQTLNLNSNQLSQLPAEIVQLTNLQTLNLNSNQLSVLPPELRQPPNLKTLDLRGNPVPIPPEILGSKKLWEDPGDVKEILDFYFRVQDPDETEPLYEAKFLIVGEGGAGKTSLAKKIETESYELQSDEESTQGIDVIQWHFTQPNGQNFRVNIWDFGGQEIYHQTHQFFLTERSLYALVADTRQENTDFYYWLKVVELLSGNSPVLLIKNEKQNRQCEVNERQLRGEFSNLKEILATNLANNRGLPKIKQAIQDYISKLSHVGTPWLKLWVRVRSALENDSRNYISVEEYCILCRINGLTDRKEMLQLSRYLHDLGVCLHFQDDSTLKHWVILKPEWGTTAVYKVLDNNTVKQNLGCFTQNDLADIWKASQYTEMRDELLQLMMRFKLCYPIPNRSCNYIAPQLLDINQPDYTWDDSNNLILRYTYEFMPKGILTRFIVETHPWIEQQKLVWRSGVVLNKDQTRAEVIEHYNQREIKIRVTGSRKKELLAVVTHELEKIHQSFERLHYQTFVPCNCEICKEGKEPQTPYSYSRSVLERRLKAGRYQIECEITYQMVDVRRLIDDVSLQPFGTEEEPERQVTYLQQKLEQEREESLTHREEKRRMTSPPEPKFEKEIFISYAWGGENEEFVNTLDRTLQEKGIKIIRDKRDLGYKGLIKAFMERIGRGKCVIAVISDKYLKSPNCMFELVQVAKNGKFYDRIFPIVLADAQIYKPVARLKYIQHWEDEIKQLDEAMKEVGAANLQGFREEIDQYTDIRNTIADLTNLLKDMNTLTPDIHSQSEFQELIDAIEKRLDE